MKLAKKQASLAKKMQTSLAKKANVFIPPNAREIKSAHDIECCSIDGLMTNTWPETMVMGFGFEHTFETSYF